MLVILRVTIISCYQVGRVDVSSWAREPLRMSGTLWSVLGRGCSWPLAGGDQGGCSAPCTAQDTLWTLVLIATNINSAFACETVFRIYQLPRLPPIMHPSIHPPSLHPSLRPSIHPSTSVGVGIAQVPCLLSVPAFTEDLNVFNSTRNQRPARNWNWS